MSLPAAEMALQTHLGDRFIDSDWRPALAAVMEAEGDTEKALDVVNGLYKSATCRSGLKLHIPALYTKPSKPHQVSQAEEDLMDKVSMLKSWNRIFGPIPSADEILDPVEEQGQVAAELVGSVEEIADLVRRETAVANGEVIEVEESEDDDDDDETSLPSRANLIILCQQLERGCMQYGDPQFSLELSYKLFKFRGILHKEELANSTQSTLDRYFK
jgi:hypothetical protein